MTVSPIHLSKVVVDDLNYHMLDRTGKRRHQNSLLEDPGPFDLVRRLALHPQNLAVELRLHLPGAATHAKRMIAPHHPSYDEIAPGELNRAIFDTSSTGVFSRLHR